ncbi:VOC family protein [Phycicoccus sonneratiae]|uniref:VOC family protein n=1 Tax=Phycicoccus sonneratiae TaxID=2807628 RepID=A0ABS2CGQ1_9MICO|nr:VOC family protein [Phycicoccus sonneraticus]MBM6399044.1 VOC family protein [Phycicoccus sonneraticus]
MPEFSGLNHVSLSVTDLDASQRFYTEVLGFRRILDVGYARICIHQRTRFVLALVHHAEGTGGRFSELATGLDHLGLAARDRDEVVEWEARLEAAGVPHSPIQDMPLGYHLNFRDPDGIALELQAPTAQYAAVLADVAAQEVSDEEVAALAARLLGPPA